MIRQQPPASGFLIKLYSFLSRLRFSDLLIESSHRWRAPVASCLLALVEICLPAPVTGRGDLFRFFRLDCLFGLRHRRVFAVLKPLALIVSARAFAITPFERGCLVFPLPRRPGPNNSSDLPRPDTSQSICPGFSSQIPLVTLAASKNVGCPGRRLSSLERWLPHPARSRTPFVYRLPPPNRMIDLIVFGSPGVLSHRPLISAAACRCWLRISRNGWLFGHFILLPPGLTRTDAAEFVCRPSLNGDRLLLSPAVCLRFPGPECFSLSAASCGDSGSGKLRCWLPLLVQL